MREWIIYLTTFSQEDEDEEYCGGVFMADNAQHALEQFWDDPSPWQVSDIQDVYVLANNERFVD